MLTVLCKSNPYRNYLSRASDLSDKSYSIDLFTTTHQQNWLKLYDRPVGGQFEAIGAKQWTKWYDPLLTITVCTTCAYTPTCTRLHRELELEQDCTENSCELFTDFIHGVTNCNLLLNTRHQNGETHKWSYLSHKLRCSAWLCKPMCNDWTLENFKPHVQL